MTDATWLPTVLTGLANDTDRLSMAGPPAFFTARARLAAVTAPNSEPDSAARAGTLMVSSSIWGAELLRVFDAADLTGVAGAFDALDLFLGATRPDNGLALRDEVVAAVAVADLDDVSCDAELVDGAGQNEFHLFFLRSAGGRCVGQQEIGRAHV